MTLTERIERLDNFFIGLLVGLLFPAILFFFYWLFFHQGLAFPGRFVRFLMSGYLLSNVIKLCGLGNLLVFYFGLQYKIDKFSKGVIASVFLYLGLILYVSYVFEPEII
ncbi:MAG: hypothetical protein KF900_11260 [Bacteroidetes bacterium]|nr:hypothetical protein [Bacteroidota bacterium]